MIASARQGASSFSSDTLYQQQRLTHAATGTIKFVTLDSRPIPFQLPMSGDLRSLICAQVMLC